MRAGNWIRSAVCARCVLAAAALGIGGERATETPTPFPLWAGEGPVPKAADTVPVRGARFHVIKKREVDADGYNWLHGVALAWHEGRLYASFGHNKGSENTATEEARGRVSDDGGRTWSEVFTMDAGEGEALAVSHGVFLSHAGVLWAFHGSFRGRMKGVHMRAYALDEGTGAWTKKGVVARDGFWPMGRPRKMDNGNWILPGIRVDRGFGGTDPAAVALSRGDDLTRWDVIPIPTAPQVGALWGESAVLLTGSRVLCIARWRKPLALAARSTDRGRTWSALAPSNLPMAASKPFAGILSTGQRYLVCTTTGDSGNARHPLTIAVGRPGENAFRRVYRIRRAVHDGPGESHPKCRLSYPYAVEHEGKLFVGYSNDGGRGGNRNSAELAVLPVTSLACPP